LPDKRSSDADYARFGSARLKTLDLLSSDAKLQRFDNSFDRWCDHAGLPDRCAVHGVRKAAARSYTRAPRARPSGALPRGLRC
jgi:hypothetical protein